LGSGATSSLSPIKEGFLGPTAYEKRFYTKQGLCQISYFCGLTPVSQWYSWKII